MQHFIYGVGALATLILGIFSGVWFARRAGVATEPADDAKMPTAYRRILVAYLLVLGVVLVYLLVALSVVELPDQALLPVPQQEASASQPPPAPPPGAPAADAVPVLYEVFPQWRPGKATVTMILYGQGFEPTSKVRVNMKGPARGLDEKKVTAHLIKLDLKPEDLVDVGSISFEVVSSKDKASNLLFLAVAKSRGSLSILGLDIAITREVQLLLLVIIAGALGCYVHALMSLADFIGNRTLTASWYWWYITRPFIGMAMAAIFYSILRGGFLAGTAADAKVVNPFGAVAIGALVGMFADKAAQKLAEIFETMFRSGDGRSGKLASPVIDRLEPPTVLPGKTALVDLKLKIIGDRLGTVTVVRLNSQERQPETVSEKEVTVQLKPEDVATERQIKITVVTRGGEVSPAVPFHVTSLAIDPAPLKSAAVGKPYEHACKASGGKPQYNWSLSAGPSWLKIDGSSGALKGTPTADGTAKVTVKVVDTDEAAVQQTFDLKTTV